MLGDIDGALPPLTSRLTKPKQSGSTKLETAVRSKLQRPRPVAPRGSKEMVIDFVSREELDLTTLKEFFEIFISSVKKEMQFHSELISPS